MLWAAPAILPQPEETYENQRLQPVPVPGARDQHLSLFYIVAMACQCPHGIPRAEALGAEFYSA